jgi:hypothetical protein
MADAAAHLREAAAISENFGIQIIGVNVDVHQGRPIPDLSDQQEFLAVQRRLVIIEVPVEPGLGPPIPDCWHWATWPIAGPDPVILVPPSGLAFQATVRLGFPGHEVTACVF